jgi:hypothetical protein
MFRARQFFDDINSRMKYLGSGQYICLDTWRWCSIWKHFKDELIYMRWSLLVDTCIKDKSIRYMVYESNCQTLLTFANSVWYIVLCNFMLFHCLNLCIIVNVNVCWNWDEIKLLMFNLRFIWGVITLLVQWLFWQQSTSRDWPPPFDWNLPKKIMDMWVGLFLFL